MDGGTLAAPAQGDDWVALSERALPVAEASSWVVVPRSGATVVFSGTARDHAPGRPGVHRLEYEAYEEPAVRRLTDVVAAARAQWPSIARVAVLHRTGVVDLCEAAVVVAVSAPHREEAFEAARFAIDELKRTAPIWKREAWAGGESWGLEAQVVSPVGLERSASELASEPEAQCRNVTTLRPTGLARPVDSRPT